MRIGYPQAKSLSGVVQTPAVATGMPDDVSLLKERKNGEGT
jgi:hypothetical protein